jgi:hypothetical protein
MRNIGIVLKSRAKNLIQSRAVKSATNTTQYQHWAELHHAAGRLVSYPEAVRCLVRARRYHPNLFAPGFEVLAIPRSKPDGHPLKKTDHSLNAMLGRMTSGPALDEIRTMAAKLVQIAPNLDDDLARKCNSFHPYVHAEVLVHDSLERDGLLQPSNFYDQVPYIGCSKPLCLLCQWYFEAKTCDVKFREGHGNLYCAWRLPDIFKRDGKAAMKQAEDIVNAMVRPIREEIFRVMRDKVAMVKMHDSNTEPTYLFGSTVSLSRDEHQARLDVQDVVSRAGKLDLDEKQVSGVIKYLFDAAQVGESRDTLRVVEKKEGEARAEQEVTDGGEDDEELTDDEVGGAGL